jgi:cytoskeletal protein CcmA (bactofilin family)
MGIQTTFIFLGVAVMTLIVWDGRRRKSKRPAAGLPESAASAACASQPDFFPVAATSETFTGAASAEAQPVARLQHGAEGSRIGVATRVSGKLIANEPVIIKGSIEGAVIAQDHRVMVTMSGSVSSYLEGREVSVDGWVAGVLKAGDKITLRSRADVRGTLEARRLECMAGARIQGEAVPMTAG